MWFYRSSNESVYQWLSNDRLEGRTINLETCTPLSSSFYVCVHENYDVPEQICNNNWSILIETECVYAKKKPNLNTIFSNITQSLSTNVVRVCQI